MPSPKSEFRFRTEFRKIRFWRENGALWSRTDVAPPPCSARLPASIPPPIPPPILSPNSSFSPLHLLLNLPLQLSLQSPLEIPRKVAWISFEILLNPSLIVLSQLRPLSLLLVLLLSPSLYLSLPPSSSLPFFDLQLISRSISPIPSRSPRALHRRRRSGGAPSSSPATTTTTTETRLNRRRRRSRRRRLNSNSSCSSN